VTVSWRLSTVDELEGACVLHLSAVISLYYRNEPISGYLP